MRVVVSHALLGDADRAVPWLHRAADEGFPCYPFYDKDPNLQPIGRSPAFQAFIGRLKARWESYRAAFSSPPGSS